MLGADEMTWAFDGYNVSSFVEVDCHFVSEWIVLMKRKKKFIFQ